MAWCLITLSRQGDRVCFIWSFIILSCTTDHLDVWDMGLYTFSWAKAQDCLGLAWARIRGLSERKKSVKFKRNTIEPECRRNAREVFICPKNRKWHLLKQEVEAERKTGDVFGDPEEEGRLLRDSILSTSWKISQILIPSFPTASLAGHILSAGHLTCLQILLLGPDPMSHILRACVFADV